MYSIAYVVLIYIIIGGEKEDTGLSIFKRYLFLKL